MNVEELDVTFSFPTKGSDSGSMHTLRPSRTDDKENTWNYWMSIYEKVKGNKAMTVVEILPEQFKQHIDTKDHFLNSLIDDYTFGTPINIKVHIRKRK